MVVIKSRVFYFLLLVVSRNVSTISLRSNHAFGLESFNSSNYCMDRSDLFRRAISIETVVRLTTNLRVEHAKVN